MVMSNNKIDNAKNAGNLLVISIAIGMQQCNAGQIAQ
jgi:hypothetical protein